MRAIFLIWLSVVNLFAGSDYYTKEIIFKRIITPTLIRVKIDDELYSKMVSNDIRIYSSNSTIENHYIKSNSPTLQSYSSDDGYDVSTVPLFLKNIELDYTDYIFKPDGIPIDRLIPNIKEDEYNRLVKIYVGNTQKEWHFILKHLLKRIKFSEKKDEEISLNSSTKFIRLRVDNSEESPLTIESLKIKTAPNYLYFMANPNQQYNIHFTKKHTQNFDNEIVKLVENNTPFIEGKLADLKKSKKIEIEEDDNNSKEKGLVIAIVIAVVVLFSIAIGLINGKGGGEESSN